VGEGCVAWPSVQSRLVTYRIDQQGQLAAAVSCGSGYRLVSEEEQEQQHRHLGHAVNRSSQPHQLQSLTARCHDNQWDAKPPLCGRCNFAAKRAAWLYSLIQLR